MNKKTLSEKVLIRRNPILEDELTSDQKEIEQALSELGYEQPEFPLSLLQKLYPMTRPEDHAKEFTVSLVHREDRTVRVPSLGQIPVDNVIITDIEIGDTRNRHYGLAVDYGSTTIIFQLIDMTSGQEIYVCREINEQRAYGEDILTRIIYGLGGPLQRKELHDVTVETFHRGFQNIYDHTGIDPASCPAMVISGNTTMVHFLLELDAWTVFSSPYAPVTTKPGFFCGRELGLHFPGQVYLMPSASNYIGGDIVSGLLTIDLQKKEEIGLFFDIGTNGELVLGNRDFLIAGAGAAGPALEGYISKYGTCAMPGAIDSIRIEDGQILFTTIEGEKPLGICGSGLIDLVAEMRLNGWVDISGQLNPDASDRIISIWNEDKQKEEYAVVYADHEQSRQGLDLYFSQTDIDQYIGTKAAAHIMVDCLLEAAGITEDELDHLYLSGAFCNHTNLESALTIGMFPDLPREKYTALPNSSLEGARVLLMDRTRFADIRLLLDRIYCVQFASMPNFTILMQAAKFIPHTDMRKYPTIAARLEEYEARRQIKSPKKI